MRVREADAVSRVPGQGRHQVRHCSLRQGAYLSLLPPPQSPPALVPLPATPACRAPSRFLPSRAAQITALKDHKEKVKPVFLYYKVFPCCAPPSSVFRTRVRGKRIVSNGCRRRRLSISRRVPCLCMCIAVRACTYAYIQGYMQTYVYTYTHPIKADVCVFP